LFDELEALYWAGVRTELENIIRTLHAWQQDELAGVSVKDEDGGNVHGFDTFLDQVGQEAREHAIHYGMSRLFKLRATATPMTPKGFIANGIILVGNKIVLAESEKFAKKKPILS